MKANDHNSTKLNRMTAALSAFLFIGALHVFADSVEMRNGDRFVGQVLGMDLRVVTLQNKNLGTVRLPRTNVLQISFGDSATATLPVASKAPVTQLATTNAGAGVSQQLLAGGVDPKLKQQIQAQFLSAAGPEANAKFDAMLQGLLNGTMSVGDLQTEARSAANQLRELKKQTGGEGNEVIDSYLEILNGFLKESQVGESATGLLPGSKSSTASPPKSTVNKP